MKSTSKMIVDPALRHLVECEREHLQCFFRILDIARGSALRQEQQVGFNHVAVFELQQGVGLDRLSFVPINLIPQLPVTRLTYVAAPE